ncbi:MAG TPA: heat-inducible transcriptional repressor HrcA [Dehalococcoidia bacterium]|nr:heat-inducible transcriptional repressor HrcA [Dehalococcoidia bacterium]
MALSERRSSILRFIVDDYVASAQPVGSQSLVSRHDLKLSSATVRNEMAALENEGMITHRHTSAGRFPSSRGYRYYVSSLMDERELSRKEQMTILHQFHQSSRELEDWVKLATSVLAHSLNSVGLATQPTVNDIHLKHLQLVEVSETRTLLVVVTSDAKVHQHTLEFASAASQEQLSGIAARLSSEFSGCRASEIAEKKADESRTELETFIIANVANLLISEEVSSVEVPTIDGISELLRQPEFEHGEKVLDTLEAVDERRLRDAIPSEALNTSGDVAIVIGDESDQSPYRNMSFVLTRYGSKDGPSGVLGILGPTRLPYGDAVSHVRYVRDLLSELLRQFYGEA